MKLQVAKPNQLENKEERAVAKLSAIAKHDVYYGGAEALVLATRLCNMHSKIDAQTIVSNVYTGYFVQYTPYACPYCGTVCLGDDAAYAHCNLDEDITDDELY